MEIRIKMKHEEFKLQQQVCKYLELKYKGTPFFSDTIANVKLNVIQASRNKSIQKNGFKMPDLVILQPNYYYAGLFIELKIKTPYKQNGELKKDEHLQGQQNTINQLNELGYFAAFAVGFDEALEIIDDYMSHVLK